VRVTGGACRGHPLRVPPGKSVRPTSDRVREALFSSLGDLTGRTVLDLYAGSGALGVEALSRGAAHACFVDRSPRSIACVGRNLAELGLEARATVRRGEARKVLAQLAAPRPASAAAFDLVFLDPPYASGEVARALQELVDSGILSVSARVVAETDRHLPPPEAAAAAGTGERGVVLEKMFERLYGDTRITMFTTKAARAPRCAALTPEAVR